MRPSVEKQLKEVAADIDYLSPEFSFRALRETAEHVSELVEANAAATFGYLMRGAIQEFANDIYKDVAVIYPAFVTEIGSRRRSEVYGGLHRTALPKHVDAGEKFQDTSFKGFERELVNQKFGHIETFERELFDDDQTGQVRSRAANIGEGFRIFEEIYVLKRLFGAAATEEGVEVAASSYDSGNVFTVAIGNRPGSYARLSQTTLEAAHVAMRKMVDPLGRKFLVVPNVLLVSVDDEMEAIRILNSPNMANVVTSGTVQGTNTATAQRVNPLMGKYTPYASPFIRQYAWMVGDMKRGFVFQRRDPMEVTQENPASGQSFQQEVYAFRARSRFEADWVEPRFAYLGNDGTAS